MKNKFTFLIFILLIFSILPNFVSADSGPKPTVDIDVLYNGNKISDASFSAQMLGCADQDKYYHNPRNLIPQLNISEYDSVNNCYWLPAFLAWGGDCRDSKCHFSYMPPKEFKLAVYIPSLDKVFISNEISRTNFNSNYEVILDSNGSAKISETTPFVRKDNVISFIKALIITLIIELLVALIYVSRTKLPKKILISVLIGSFITLPIVWFIFPLIKIIPLVILLSEIFAIVFEAYFIYYLNKQTITLKKSFVLSIIINLASLIIGGFIYFIFQVLLVFFI
jgi:hypothetical protein